MTTETQSSLEQLKAAIESFEQLMDKHSEFGAGDTEPDYVFQRLLADALKGERPEAPEDARSWDLYTGMTGVEKAAAELSKAAQKCIDIISATPLGDLGEVGGYLRGTDESGEAYCWRISG